VGTQGARPSGQQWDEIGEREETLRARGGQMTIETERRPTRNAASQWLMTRRDCPGEEGA